MSEKFTQGTIIEYVRSVKYPGIRCEGIVISARCDLAQEKINYFHCLSAMNIDKWIYEVLFENVVYERKNNIAGNIKKYCEQKKLDYGTLCDMAVESARKTLLKSASPKDQKNIQIIIEEEDQIDKLMKAKIDEREKKEFLYKNKKIVESKLKALYNGSFPKFAFIPEKAYSTGTSSVKGLVVDLQDVIQFDIKDKKPLLAYEYDYKLQKSHAERKYINKPELFTAVP